MVLILEKSRHLHAQFPRARAAQVRGIGKVALGHRECAMEVVEGTAALVANLSKSRPMSFCEESRIFLGHDVFADWRLDEEQSDALILTSFR